MSESPELTRTAQLLLIRLLPVGKSRPSPKKLREELAKFGANLASDETWNALVAELAGAGLLTERPLGLTEAGRNRALHMLGLSSLPPRLTWPLIRDKHLVLLAAGGGAPKEFAGKDRLAATLLKRKYNLPLPPGSTLAVAAAALVCRELGFPQLTDMKSLEAAVISRLLDAPQALLLRDAIEQLVRLKLNAPRGKVEELRQAIIARWIGQSNADEHSSKSERNEELHQFARAVERSAKQSPSGWFGENKLFINHAWGAFRAGGNGQAEMDLASFKQRLVQANVHGLLRLGRADLVAAMNAEDVHASQTRYLNTEFHFLLIDGEPK